MTKLQVEPNPNIKKNLCANKMIKGIRNVASGDPALLTFLKKLASASYYDYETGNFVLDIGKWHEGMPVHFRAVFCDNVETNNFEVFFVQTLEIYHSYLWFQSQMPFLVDNCIMENVMSYVAQHRFCPPHMEIIDNVPNELLNKTEGQNDPPMMLPEIPLLIAATDNYFIQQGCQDYQSVSSISFGMRDQYTNSVITGISSKGIESNLANMATNKVEVDDISNELLISAVLMMLHDNDAYNQERVRIQVPERGELERLIKTYKTGTGVVPVNNYVTSHVYSNGICDIDRKKPKTKKALAKHLDKLITEALEDLFDSGEIRDRVFPGVSVCVSARKFEILNATDCSDLQELESMHSKLRLFFVESAHCIFLSYIALKGLFEFLSRNGWENGTLLNDGGFFDIFRRHSCGTAGYDKDKFKDI